MKKKIVHSGVSFFLISNKTAHGQTGNFGIKGRNVELFCLVFELKKENEREGSLTSSNSLQKAWHLQYLFFYTWVNRDDNRMLQCSYNIDVSTGMY